MPCKVIITRDFDHLSEVAARFIQERIKQHLAQHGQFNLGLATGSSPTGVYKHLAKTFNRGELDATQVRSFNLDEYIGLPGANAQMRALHPESYCFFMVQELFGLLRRKFSCTQVPCGNLVDPARLTRAEPLSGASARQLTTDPGHRVLRTHGDGDGGLFTGILVRYLALAARSPDLSPTARARAQALVEGTADAFWSGRQVRSFPRRFGMPSAPITVFSPDPAVPAERSQPDGIPLVLAGDFNASADHPGYRQVADGLVDAHRAVGAGWVRTWPLGRRSDGRSSPRRRSTASSSVALRRHRPRYRKTRAGKPC